MSKLTRIFHKIFGANADFGYQMGKVGSFKNGDPQYAANITDIQSLANFETGLYGALVGDGAPCVQDMNAILFHSSRQLGYLFQQGIPEWDSDTVYYTNSFCSYNGVLYKSSSDNNSNNTPSVSSSYWSVFSGNPDAVYYSAANLNTYNNDVLTRVDFETKVVDDKNLVSTPSTNWGFTAAKTGFYMVDFQGLLKQTNLLTFSGNFIAELVGTTIGTQVFFDGYIDSSKSYNSSSNDHTFAFSKLVYLQKDELVRIFIKQNIGTFWLTWADIKITKMGA